jgi:L-ascorbate metabolism protein UlaG (beta-lactamase superfamily)
MAAQSRALVSLKAPQLDTHQEGYKYFTLMKKTRRRFLAGMLAATGATIGGGAWWIGSSERRGAMFFRKLMADTQRRIAAPAFAPRPHTWSENNVTICWLGHATVLINFYGIHILTDPALASHVGISLRLGTLGPKRYIAPALQLHQLPPIDVLLLSHAHMDHMDLPTLRALEPSTFTVSAKETTDILARTPLRQIRELRWNERAMFSCARGDLEITAFEVRHWGRRWPNEDVARGYNGYIIRREGSALVFGGDTAHTPLFKQISPRGPFLAAIMPIAAYDPWISSHCTPEEALEMTNDAGARFIVPVHHQTFRLSDEPMEEPIQRLIAATDNEPERLALRDVGEVFVCPAA